MYKLISALLFIIFISGCKTSEVFPLTTHYQPDPIVTRHISNVPREDVWNKVVRFFADQNLPIKTIDKSSGFIQSDLLSFTASYQIDSDTASITHPLYVIAQRETAYKMLIQPSYITGSLKIFVLPDGNNTEVRVHIENLKNYHIVDIHHKHSSVITHDEISRQVISTSSLENQISEYISTGDDTIHVNIQKGEILNPKNNYSTYLRKHNNRFLAGLLGGVLGGDALLIPVLLLLKKHR